MRMQSILAALLIGASSQAYAVNADITLSEDTARFSMSYFISGFNDGRSLVNAGYLYNDDSDHIVDVGLHVIDVVGSKTPGLQIGVGIQVYFADIGKDDGLALTLGGDIGYRPPQARRMHFSVHGHYAPGIVSYIDAERFYEYGAQIGYSLLPQADIFIGYRKIEMKTDNGKLKADDGGHLGLRISF